MILCCVKEQYRKYYGGVMNTAFENTRFFNDTNSCYDNKNFAERCYCIIDSDETKSYELFGVEKEHVANTILKKHHQILIFYFHPDKNTHKSADEQVLAHEATIKINTLYEELKEDIDEYDTEETDEGYDDPDEDGSETADKHNGPTSLTDCCKQFKETATSDAQLQILFGCKIVLQTIDLDNLCSLIDASVSDEVQNQIIRIIRSKLVSLINNHLELQNFLQKLRSIEAGKIVFRALKSNLINLILPVTHNIPTPIIDAANLKVALGLIVPAKHRDAFFKNINVAIFFKHYKDLRHLPSFDSQYRTSIIKKLSKANVFSDQIHTYTALISLIAGLKLDMDDIALVLTNLKKGSKLQTLMPTFSECYNVIKGFLDHCISTQFIDLILDERLQDIVSHMKFTTDRAMLEGFSQIKMLHELLPSDIQKKRLLDAAIQPLSHGYKVNQNGCCDHLTRLLNDLKVDDSNSNAYLSAIALTVSASAIIEQGIFSSTAPSDSTAAHNTADTVMRLQMGTV